ncbi:hypothetical protein [Sorangium sp. So ce1097]|uniref:hypothetical protein n=1 Tax=Sorangium sp. So ce1097 TaxID=3133330 RepID=UPI003F5E518F
MALRIEARSGSHRALITDFQNQRTSLVEYLKRFALRHAEKGTCWRGRTWPSMTRRVERASQATSACRS